MTVTGKSHVLVPAHAIAAFWLGILLLLMPLAATAEEDVGGSGIVIIYLKNNGRIEGVIMEESAGGVVVDVGYGTVSISASDIKHITYPSGEERERAERGWRAHADREGMSADEKEAMERGIRLRAEESLKLKGEMGVKGAEVKFADKSRIKVGATLNDKVQARFIVDTGAPMVYIKPAIAARLFATERKGQERIRVRWLDGTETSGTPVVLRSIKVGDAEARNVKAVISQMPDFFDRDADGLIGMTFLNRFNVTIDANNNKLILEDK